MDLYNEKNFRKLFDEFYRPLVNFAAKQIKDEAAAEDIVQDLFVYLWDNELSFKDEIALKTYLYRSLLNRCRNYFRDKKLRLDYEKEYLASHEEADYSYMNDIIREEVYRKLAIAVDHLPPQCRRIYDMVQKGMTSVEIAEEMGLSVETVKRQRKIARKMLQDELGKLAFVFLMGSVMNF